MIIMERLGDCLGVVQKTSTIWLATSVSCCFPRLPEQPGDEKVTAAEEDEEEEDGDEVEEVENEKEERPPPLARHRAGSSLSIPISSG